MTAPYRPTLISPGAIGASEASSVTFVFEFNAFVAGATAHEFAIRRRTTGSTVGAYEYWDGTAWQATDQWNSAPANVYDGQTVSETVTVGWVSGTIYEWSAKFRNSSNEEGEWARAHLLAIETAPTLTFSGDNPTTDSRPTINWVFSGDTGRRQAAYQIALYNQTVSNDASFDPADATWQAQAIDFMDEFKYSQTDYSYQPDIDLPTAESYDLYYRVEDDYGFRTDWAEGFVFDSTFTPPFVPDLIAEYQSGTGVMNVTIASAFNMLDNQSSNFDSGLGAWFAYDNAILTNPTSEMLVESIQDNYDQLITNHSTYAGMTSATTYATLSGTQTDNTGFAVAQCGPLLDGTLAFEVENGTNGTVYSATVNVNMQDATANARLDLLWYDDAGTYLSTSSGSLTSCAVGVDTDVANWDETAPANGKYVALQLFLQMAIGDQCVVNNATLVPASEAVYSPGGATGITFVLQRSEDGGQTWDFVWNASRDSPHPVENQLSQRSVVQDRAVRFAKDIKYRAFARGITFGSVQYSAPNVIDVPAVSESKWWLRSITDSSKDITIRAATMDETYEQRKEVYYPVGGSNSIVVSSDEAVSRKVNVSVTTIAESEFDSLLDFVQSNNDFFLQRNVGENLYLQQIGEVNKTRKRARGRHLYEVSFSAEVCSAPVS